MTTKPRSIDIPLLVENKEFSPHYASLGAAGADVKAHLKEPLVIPPGTSALVSSGLRLAIPEGFEIQVRPRSGLALNHLITILNTPGTIDSDYRGEVGIILINHGKNDFIVTPGMRIAQLVLAQVIQANFIHSEALSETKRGPSGFGHTGIN